MWKLNGYAEKKMREDMKLRNRRWEHRGPQFGLVNHNFSTWPSTRIETRCTEWDQRFETEIISVLNVDQWVHVKNGGMLCWELFCFMLCSKFLYRFSLTLSWFKIDIPCITLFGSLLMSKRGKDGWWRLNAKVHSSLVFVTA